MTGGGPRPELPSTLIRAAAVAVVVALVGGLSAVSITSAVGAGGSEPAKTIPTPPDSTDVVGTAETVPGSSEPLPSDVPATGDVPPTSEVVIDTEIALSANAQISEMLALSAQLIGPTSDVAASLRAFAAIPEGIPSPIDSTIEEFSIDYYGELGFYSADAVFTSSAEPDDVVVFYETTLTAAGFTLLQDGVQTDPNTDVQTHTLEFQPPNSGYSGASVRVVIDSDEEPRIYLEITDSVNPATLAAFGGWARGVPTIGEGVPVVAGLSAVSDPSLILTVRTEFLYDGRTADELTTEVRDALADSPAFQIADDDEGGSEIRMTHRIIVDPVADISDSDGDTTMVITGSLQI